MSMLSSQADKLRSLADHLDETERGMDEYVQAMREAADTIESLRDRLQAERTCHVNELDALTQTLSMANGCSWGECSECGCLTPIDSVFCIECGAKVKHD